MEDNYSLVVIGDVHQKIDEYARIIKNIDNNINSIQVGDFGFANEHEWHLKNIDHTKHKINFGNHDDYTYLDKSHSLKNWSLSPNGIMTVRGAHSKDKALRFENIDWWPNEELNYEQMQDVIDLYIANKPKIMITHDCPYEVRQSLFGINDKSITTNGLQAMFEAHQPELWIFGHHHSSKNEIINGTKFICLSELETITI